MVDKEKELSNAEIVEIISALESIEDGTEGKEREDIEAKIREYYEKLEEGKENE